MYLIQSLLTGQYASVDSGASVSDPRSLHLHSLIYYFIGSRDQDQSYLHPLEGRHRRHLEPQLHVSFARLISRDYLNFYVGRFTVSHFPTQISCGVSPPHPRFAPLFVLTRHPYRICADTFVLIDHARSGHRQQRQPAMVDPDSLNAELGSKSRV